MFAKKTVAALLTVLLVAAAVGPAASAAATQQASTAEQGAYAGTHVSFQTTESAIVDYGVDGAVLIDSVAVESHSEAEQRGEVEAGVGLSTVTDVLGSSVSIDAQTDTRVSIATGSGASVESHDSTHGHLVVTADGETQLVGVDVAADSEAEQESDARVVVTAEDGAQGTFIVVGEGEVVVNDEGNVTAELSEDAKLVYRQYAEERSDEDREQEELIAEGTAAAEVYVTMAAEGGQQAAADVVQYGEDTTVEVITHSENEIRMTAERTEHEGRVIITSVSDAAFDAAGDVEVLVDGEAAASVDSYSDLRAAADGGEESAFMVQQATTAEAATEVLVAVNHFSERDVTVQSDGEASDEDASADDEADDGMAADDSDDETADDDSSIGQPGFGVLATLTALAAIFFGRRRL